MSPSHNMFTSPQKRGGGASPPTKRVPLKGLFMDGVWHCNCDPRMPATHFEVRKEGPNKGRWFYTCQKPKESACGLFLWDTAASSREMRAVISNTRSETEPPRTMAPPQPKTPSKSDTSKNWIQSLGKSKVITLDDDVDDDDEFGDWPLTQEEEANVVSVAESSVPPETPRKALKSSPFITPGSKRKRDQGYLPTPASESSDDIFDAPSTSRLKGGMWDGNEPFGLRSPSKTPTPNRFRDITEPQDAQGGSKLGSNLVDEVMDLLKDQKIDGEVRASLHELLSKHALKHSGIIKGRDITRLALATKDNKIADLQQRITVMETEREVDKAVIKHLKDNMTNSLNSKGGQGRGRS